MRTMKWGICKPTIHAQAQSRKKNVEFNGKRTSKRKTCDNCQELFTIGKSCQPDTYYHCRNQSKISFSIRQETLTGTQIEERYRVQGYPQRAQHIIDKHIAFEAKEKWKFNIFPKQYPSQGILNIARHALGRRRQRKKQQKQNGRKKRNLCEKYTISKRKRYYI